MRAYHRYRTLLVGTLLATISLGLTVPGAAPATAARGPEGTLTTSGLPAEGDTSAFSNTADATHVLCRIVHKLIERDFRGSTASRAGFRIRLVTPFYFADRIRHRNRFGELTTTHTVQDKGEAWFLVTTRLSDPAGVSIAAISQPAACLRRRDFRIRLAE